MSELFKNQTYITNTESCRKLTVFDELEALALRLYKTPEDARTALTRAIFNVDYEFKVGQAIAVTFAKKEENMYKDEIEKVKIIPIEPVVINDNGEKRLIKNYKMEIITYLKNNAPEPKIKKGVRL